MSRYDSPSSSSALSSALVIILLILSLIHSMLLAIKEVKALDISGDGRITEKEFKRIYSPAVLAAAEVKVKADAIWAAPTTTGPGKFPAKKDAKGACNGGQRWLIKVVREDG